MKQRKDKKSEVLATKVSPEARALIERIAGKMGMASYGLLNLMLSSFVRFADDIHNLDPQLNKIINIFDRFEGWSEATSITSTNDKKVSACVYIISENNDRHHGSYPLLVFDRISSTHNVQEVLDVVLRSCSPLLHKRLKRMGKELDTTSVLETITELLDMFERGRDEDSEYIRQLFEDNERSDYGGRDCRPKKYVPHNKKSVLQYELRFETQDTSNNEQG